MNPIPLFWLAYVLFRLLTGAGRAPTEKPASAADTLRGLWLVLSVGAGGVAAGLAVYRAAPGELAALGPSVGLALLATALLSPWTFARWVWIPLGLPRVARALLYLHPGVGDRRDPHGAAALAAALATLRLRAPSARDLAYLERAIAACERLRGSGVVAAGLTAALRGDAAATRRMFAGLAALPPETVPRTAFDAAFAWRAADLASRGEWGELARWRGLVDGSAGPYALAARARLACAVAAYRREYDRLAPFHVTPPHWLPRLRVFFRALGECHEDLLRDRWERIERLTGLTLRARAMPASVRFLVRVAERLAGAPTSPSPRLLWLSWALVPSRRAALPLLRRALAAEPPRPTPPPLDSAHPDPWVRGLDALTRAIAPRCAHRAYYLHRAARAWDQAFTEGAMESVAAAMEGGHEPDARISPALYGQATELLANLLLAHELPISTLAEGGLVSDEASELARERLIEDVSELAKALGGGAKAPASAPAAEHWAAFCRLVQANERAATLGGPLVRRLVWGDVHRGVGVLAVDLFNVRKERTLAHGMFVWLLKQATELEDQAAITLESKNVRAGLW